MSFPHAPLCIALAAVSLGLGVPAASSQESQPRPSVPALRPPGPTREARAATAQSFALKAPLPAPQILPRYIAFQREFDADFGLPVAGRGALQEDDFMNEMEKWLAGRWGDTSFYTWVERALIVYAQVQASTSFERKGFNMGVDVDDVTQGKLGVRVSRALE